MFVNNIIEIYTNICGNDVTSYFSYYVGTLDSVNEQYSIEYAFQICIENDYN